MTTLAEFMIIAGADNHPPMLEKSMYDSWKSRMGLYMENKENMRMILDSIQNGPLVWPTIVQEDGTTRKREYEELSPTKKIQADCDLKATNIVLQGLPPDVYAIVNHHKVAKEIWDRVKLLMQDTTLSLQERECKLYDEFDKFSFAKGETLYQNQATIQDVRVTVQQVQGIQGQSYASIRNKGNATRSEGNNAGGQARVVKCYHFQGEGHIARQYEEQLAFLAYPDIPDGQATQTTIPNNVAFQSEDLDAYDSECDDVSTAKAVLMANLSNYGSDVLSEVPHSEPYHNDMDNQSVHTMQDFEQTPVVDFPDNEITSDSNIIPFEAPSELSKVGLVNTSLKKLKINISKFNIVVKKRITPDGLTEGEWGFEHTKAIFLNEIISFLKTLKDIFDVFDKDLLNDVTEVQTVFSHMEAVVQQCSDVLLTLMNSSTVYGDSVNVEMQSSESCD
ncbi:hypothetical protein Tco_0600052 [Tanacetum coccineum]|uniref:Integrase, catalytic region, zinc finger, CCHC-type, peptidase aspartic, catalytic n=1 Tax=Tanacetum coccineum TaxID=301880 RepID=A0ABQ4WAP6_9ASTR